jgi:hypothetical protein
METGSIAKYARSWIRSGIISQRLQKSPDRADSVRHSGRTRRGSGRRKRKPGRERTNSALDFSSDFLLEGSRVLKIEMKRGTVLGHRPHFITRGYIVISYGPGCCRNRVYLFNPNSDLYLSRTQSIGNRLQNFLRQCGRIAWVSGGD